MNTRTLAALVAALVLGACGVPEVEPTQLIPQQSIDKTQRRIEDAEVIQRAVRALVNADTGSFRSTLLIGGGETDFVDAKGAWHFSNAEGWMRISSTPNEGARTAVDFRYFSGGVYVRSTNGRKVGCWHVIAVTEALPLTPAGRVLLPSQIQALLTAEGAATRSPRDTAKGTVALGDAVGVIGPVWDQAVRKAGPTAQEVRLPVTFTIKNDRFTGWKVLGEDILDALQEGDVKLSGASIAVLPGYSVKVVLSEPDADVEVEAPAATC